jgi:hypothetical protein
MMQKFQNNPNRHSEINLSPGKPSSFSYDVHSFITGNPFITITHPTQK